MRTGSFSTHLPVGDIALWCQSQHGCGHREQCLKQNLGRDLPAARRATYRWGTSRYGVNRNVNAGDANSVLNRTQGATCPPLGAPATAGGSRAYVSIETKLRASRTASQTRLSARLALRRSVGGFGGSRRFLGTSRGNPVVLAPGIGRKIAAHTIGKAVSLIRGISKGCPLGSLLHPFLERKGWRAVPAARLRCSAIGNKNA